MQADALGAGLRLQRLHQRLTQAGGLQRLSVQRQGMRFDLREVEHIIDDGLQQMRRVGGMAEQGLLLGLEPPVLQQIQHPQHRIHGGADLVSHHGQEL
ncbi:hypothetical protein D3C80_824740 [compost metagenome]